MNLTKKDSVESAKYDIFFCLNLYLQFSGVFFMDPDPDFPDRVWIFWSIRVWTQEKKSDLDPDNRTRIWNTGFFPVLSVLCCFINIM